MNFDKDQIKLHASHIKTVGAYVQTPNPMIIGLGEDEVVGSQDAKSLYPTIMAMLNIGYDSLYGRIYDSIIVSNIINFIKYSINTHLDDQNSIDTILFKFKESIKNTVTTFCKNNDCKKKGEYITFTEEYYTELFRRILVSNETFDDISNPKTDRQYYLLKTRLLPILEAITWISPKNKGYNDTTIDFVFFNDKFETKYNNTQFYIVSDINSTRPRLNIIDYKTALKQFLGKYIITPYGVLFQTHANFKSFEVDLIFGGMDDRALIKNRELILSAITTNWSKLDQTTKDYLKTALKIDEHNANIMLDIVGDSNDDIRSSQLKSLTEVELPRTENGLKELSILVQQLKGSQSGIKVTLNTGYGIYAMNTWAYASSLISNSITSGGKIYGIKLFQQIASNITSKERLKIKNDSK